MEEETTVTVVNLSNHYLTKPIKESLQKYFKNKELNEQFLYSRVDLNGNGQDLWQKVECIVEKINLPERGETCLILPSLKEVAVMTAIFTGEVNGTYPYIGLVTKKDGLPRLQQILDMEAWKTKCRLHLAKKV